MSRNSINRPEAGWRPLGGRWRRRWGPLLLLGWTLAGVLFVSPAVLGHLVGRGGGSWTGVVASLAGWYLWGILCSITWWVTRRFPFERSSWRRWVLRQLATGLAVAVVAVSFIVALAWMGPDAGAGTGGLGMDYLLPGLAFYLIVYCGCVGLFQAFTFRETRRERELRSSKQQGQMALAQLQVLKMQLHPHFLFNTLNAISALMHRDVDAADRMIAQLSDLLRVSLDKDDRHEVPLSTELDFLERYLAIEKIRFRDRLKVEMDVEPPCFDAFVPKLILQPLVENAIRHGIAMRSAAGQVAIRVRGKGSRIEIEVSDDGPGLPPDGHLREGVGLTNTRARLEQLYGAEHRIELRRAPIGGLLVHLEMPFEVEARIAE